jgi:hypothetical protein
VAAPVIFQPSRYHASLYTRGLCAQECDYVYGYIALRDFALRGSRCGHGIDGVCGGGESKRVQVAVANRLLAPPGLPCPLSGASLING